MLSMNEDFLSSISVSLEKCDEEYGLIFFNTKQISLEDTPLE